MARTLTLAMLNQLLAEHKRPAILAQLAFENETFYLWSGLGPITWNGHTWLGLGWLGRISPIVETTDVTAQNITLTLMGIASHLLGEAISYVRQNSEVTIWLGFLDDNNQIVADPARSFDGHMDVPTVSDGKDTCSISVTVENPLVDLNGACNRRYTDCDQQMDYPGDLGFRMVGELQNLYLHWPPVL